MIHILRSHVWAALQHDCNRTSHFDKSATRQRWRSEIRYSESPLRHQANDRGYSFRPVTGQTAVGANKMKNKLYRFSMVVCSVVHRWLKLIKTRRRTRGSYRAPFVDGIKRFAPNGGNPCDNLHSELKLFDIAEQHRAHCHESGAVKELTRLPVFGSVLRQNVAQASVLV